MTDRTKTFAYHVGRAIDRSLAVNDHAIFDGMLVAIGVYGSNADPVTGEAPPHIHDAAWLAQRSANL